MTSMFSNCSSLEDLVLYESDEKYFNTTNVTTMLGMFYGCSSLTSLDLKKFDTSSVTNMGAMFEQCKGLLSIDVSSFDTSKVENMQSMFYYCSSLTTIDLSNFSTESLLKFIEQETSSGSGKYNQINTYTELMFAATSNLKTVILGENFELTEPIVITLKKGYTKDENGEIVGGTESQVNVLNSMFEQWYTIKTIYAPNENTYNILTNEEYRAAMALAEGCQIINSLPTN